MLKNIIISTFIGIITFIAIGFVTDQTLIRPFSPQLVIELLIIIAAIFAGSLLAAGQAALDTDYSSNSYSNSSAEPSDHETGTVKWFNVKKGYGFITRDQGDDIFVHYRNIEGGGRRGVNEGQRVSFIVIDGDKGLQADEVTTI